jgi:hypothetical protein
MMQVPTFNMVAQQQRFFSTEEGEVAQEEP